MKIFSSSQFEIATGPIINESVEKSELELKSYISRILSKSSTKNEKYIINISHDEYLNDDAYSLTFNCNKLDIKGGKRGVLYAVYSLLEKYFGVRYYTPDCEKVNNLENVEFPDSYYQLCEPQFALRDVMWSCGYNENWSVKQKINRGHWRKFSNINGGGLTFANYFVHTFGELTEEGYEVDQPCLTDEKIYQIVLKNVRACLHNNPNANYIAISQNDDFRYCKCPECMKIADEEGSYMATLLRFVNRIADDIALGYPDVKVYTLAYQYTRKPPSITKPRYNVVVQLCSIECCFSHPLNECDIPAPAPWMIAHLSKDSNFQTDLIGWGKIAPNLHIWDYTTNYHHYFTPFPNLGVLRKNIAFFAENNVNGVLEQGNINSPESGEFAELKSYLLAKLLWDPFMSEDCYENLINEFLSGFYGNGWIYIKEFIKLLEANSQNSHFGIYYHPTKILKIENEKEFIQKSIDLFDSALAIAKGDDEKIRIERARVQIIYYSQIINYENAQNNEISRKAYILENQKLYSFIKDQSIYMNPDIHIPDNVDFSKSPDLWHKL